jgi:HEAT repeat protein
MTTRSAARLSAVAILFACAASSLKAQEVTWVETSFHRVHLLNGNFIDGQVLKVTDNDVFLRLSAGDMAIRKNTIDRIELVKMRSIKEKPKLDPPLKKVPAAEIGTPLQRLKSASSFPPAPASDELIQNVGAILSRLKIAKPDQKDGLIEQLAGMPHAGAYEASLIPTVDEEAAYALRSALLRSKDPQAAPYLVRALDSDKAYVQMTALSLLGILGTVDDCRSIRPFLSDSFVPAVRSMAIETLQQLKDVSSLGVIADLVGVRDDAIRLAAINAALELGLQNDRGALVSDSIRRNLNGSQGKVAKELLSAITRGKFTDLWSAAVPFLSDSDPLLRKTAAFTLQTLAVPDSIEAIVIRLQQEEDTRILVELANAAAKLKSSSAIPALIRLLGNDSNDVVQAAAAALTVTTHERFGTNKAKWTEWWDRNSAR